MAQRQKAPSFEAMIERLRAAGFETADAGPGQVRVSRDGCAAVLTAGQGSPAAFAVRPGYLVDGEISRLLDRGFQKFLKTSGRELPATAEALGAVHRFSEQLKEITGSISLDNESLGTGSDRYLYDRVQGRELPAAERRPRPWELPAETGSAKT
jgi:hypothetical protein